MVLSYLVAATIFIVVCQSCIQTYLNLSRPSLPGGFLGETVLYLPIQYIFVCTQHLLVAYRRKMAEDHLTWSISLPKSLSQWMERVAVFAGQKHISILPRVYSHGMVQ